MIEEVLTYVVFFTEIIVFNYIEYRCTKTLISPFFFLTIPFATILIICLIFNSRLGFIPFNTFGLWIWNVGMCFFWVSSLLVTWIIRKLSISSIVSIPEIPNICDKRYKLITIFFLFVICIALTSLLRGIGDAGIGSKELGEEVGQGGITGRIANLLLVAFPLYYIMKYRIYFKISFLCAVLFFIFSLGSKTWLMYSVLTCFIISTRYGLRINLKLIAIGVILLFGLFSCYYYMNTDIDDVNHFGEFILRHFYFYLTSGILPLGKVIDLDHNIHINGLHHPFINLLRYHLGENVAFHSNVWVITDLYLGKKSNVFTFFGHMWIDGNTLEFVIYSFLTGFVSYLITGISRCLNNTFLNIAAAYTLSVLFFGWYNCGFFFLRIWEIYIFSVIGWFFTKKYPNITLSRY